MTEEKEFKVWKHFVEWEGWTCDKCGELIESDERSLKRHLQDKHNIIYN